MPRYTVNGVALPAKGRPILKEDTEGNTKRILEFIQEHPACHLRQIKKELGISVGTAQYHLTGLERAGKVTADRHGLFKYYFAVGIFQDREKSLLEVLSHETTRDILMFIIEQNNPTHKDIVNRIGVSGASISWHVRRFIELGIITEVEEGKHKRYQLRGDPELLVSLMKNYYPSLWDKWSNRLAEMFLSLSREEEKEP